jgi:V/A-type H+-transporting ATPase subunit B
VTPRIALTVAEHLAFELGRHVLVVIADVTSHADAVREVSAARGEVPSQRGYPGYLYSDLASIYERAGRIKGRPGSVTQVPVLTMPAGDITHPVPDLTGYITEGQVVLSQELHVAGVYPPFDPLSSLSRLMRLGAGPGRTRDDHLEIAAQLYAFAAESRRIADLADVVGEAGLTGLDRRYLAFAGEFRSGFLSQGRTEARTLDDTLARAWRVAATLPRRELAMVTEALVEAHYPKDVDEDPDAAG